MLDRACVPMALDRRLPVSKAVGHDGRMRLLLIRHGQTSSNIAQKLDTAAPGADLSELGRRQAAAIPAALAEEDIGAVYASNLVRAQQTAQPLADALGLQPIIRAGIREIAAGDLEMRSDDESIQQYVDAVFGWPEDLERRVPGGESGTEVLARFDEVVAEAAGSGVATVAFVSHGAMIRVWVGIRSTNRDTAYTLEHWLLNTAMVALEGSVEDGWTVLQWTEGPLGGPELADPAHTGPTGEPDHAHPA